ncbi:dienelactone hydrolase family protein [soil metagenome]
MGIERRVTVYEGPGGLFESVAVVDSGWTGPKPGILLLPNVLGTKEGDFVRGERLAAMGYAVLVADVFGQGKRTTRADPEAGRYMAELNADRALLRARLQASLDTLKAMPEVDAGQCGAIGFCFGGKCVIDMARGGLDVKGVVSFHGVYDPLPVAGPIANVETITAKLLICHGWEDPYAPLDATAALATELTVAKADWQIHAYGHTGHAFTDEAVNMPEKGLAYNADADRRSWQAMANFLEECFA